MTRRILVIEDGEQVARELRDTLPSEGYEVEHASTGKVGLGLALAWRPDLMLLDVVLPDIDGFALCHDLAGRGLAPIIILTARSSEADKVHGLQVGADDYITKPFSVRELLARINMVLRRAEGDRAPAGQVRFAQIVVDLDALRVERNGVLVPLTQKEMELLRLLVSHPDHAFTREELLRLVWGYIEAPLTRTVDTHVARLRHKLEDDPHKPRHIQTVYGTGYAFKP